MRYYNVFNLEQCEGIGAPEPEETVNEFTPVEKAEQIIAGMPNRPNIFYTGDRAFYRPSEDRVQIPHKHTFERSEDFYAVLAHELSHSTGARHRLARKEVMERNSFGSDDYSAEELVAEFAASFLCAEAGISNETIEMSASYIDGWLSVLKSDSRLGNDLLEVLTAMFNPLPASLFRLVERCTVNRWGMRFEFGK